MTRLLLLAGRCRNEIAALQNVHLSDTVDPILADQKKKKKSRQLFYRHVMERVIESWGAHTPI